MTEANLIPPQGWKRELRCVANTPGEVLFDMMEREDASICFWCREHFFQEIGQAVDHTNRFKALRKRCSEARELLLISHISKIETNLIEFQQVSAAPLPSRKLQLIFPLSTGDGERSLGDLVK